MVKMATPVDFARVAEAAFLHHTTRRGVVDEEIAPKSIEALLVEAVVNHKLQCFGAKALVPVGLGDPIAQFRVLFADVDIALTVRIIAHATNGLASFLEFDGPSVVVMENGADDS